MIPIKMVFFLIFKANKIIFGKKRSTKGWYLIMGACGVGEFQKQNHYLIDYNSKTKHHRKCYF